MRPLVLYASLLTVLTAPAMAQTVAAGPGKVVTGPPGLPSVQPYSSQPSNITPSDTRSTIAPALPSANLGPNATPADFLQVAQRALSANQLGLAQSSIENAMTLLLTRSVPLGTTGTPDQNPAIQNLNQALQSLAAHDTATTMNLVQQVLSSEMTAQAAPPPPPPPGAMPPAGHP